MSHCHRYTPAAGISRRAWLTRMTGGLGAIAMADLLSGQAQASLAGLPHYPAKAKRIIFLTMTGGMSHLESFDHKPELNRLQGEQIPTSVMAGKKPLGMSSKQSSFPLVGSSTAFAQHGQSGAWISASFPHLAKVADDLTFVKSLFSDAVNHDPALAFLQTGAQLPGRPSIGAWLDYGLGSINKDLPSFITLTSNRPVDQPLSSRMWDSGFLPSRYAGVQFRSGNDPVLYLSDPQGVPRDATRRMLDSLKDLHEMERASDGDAVIDSKIEQFEMAYRMQSAVPEATDISKEPQHILDLYGEDVNKPGSFAKNCLLARRLAERDVRYIQLFHPGWDHHGSLPEGFKIGGAEVDRAAAALITDLKQRDMLKDTLVVFGSEFGRTSYSQGGINKKTGNYGREHHRDCFTFWMAGGGIKPGISYGNTCEFGFRVAGNPVSMHDFHATVLHLMGIDHERFTHRYQGRDFRLTDVSGKVVQGILA